MITVNTGMTLKLNKMNSNIVHRLSQRLPNKKTYNIKELSQTTRNTEAQKV